MLEKLKYRNHLGETINFGEEGVFVNLNDLHDYAWSITNRNKRIAKLNRDIQQRKMPVVICCDTPEQGVATANRLFEVVEKDCLAGKYGRLIIGDYYCECFVTGSAKKDYLYTPRYMLNTLTVETDRPYWIKETTTLFRKQGEGTGAFFNFPTNFPYDYRSSLIAGNLVNGNFVDADFVITIYGFAENPRIVIGGHEYQVNVTVGEGEYLTIDSVSKTIMLTSNNGTKTSKFNDRNRNSYIFQKIPVDSNVVTWSGDWGFDVVLKEERSEPKWSLT